jgi:hypothetical protein
VGLAVAPSVSLPVSSSLEEEDSDDDEDGILPAPFCWGGPREGIARPVRLAFPKIVNLCYPLSLSLSLSAFAIAHTIQFRNHVKYMATCKKGRLIP